MSKTPISEALHLGWKLKLLLCIKVINMKKKKKNKVINMG